MPATEISIDQAKKDKLFYFVASAIVYRESDGRCLILRRDPREKVHPGKYGVTGGKLEWGDFPIAQPSRIDGDVIEFDNAVEKLVAREVEEEAGVKIAEELAYLKSVLFVRPDGIPVVLQKFAAKYAGGEVRLQKGSFTDYAWVNAEEIKQYDCIEGIAQEVAAAIARFAVKAAA